MVVDRPDRVDARYEDADKYDGANGDLEQVVLPRCNCASICVFNPHHVRNAI